MPTRIWETVQIVEMWKTSHTFSTALRSSQSTKKTTNLCKNCISIDSIDSQRTGMIRTMHAEVRRMRYMDKEMQRPLGSHKNKQAKILQGTHTEPLPSAIPAFSPTIYSISHVHVACNLTAMIRLTAHKILRSNLRTVMAKLVFVNLLRLRWQYFLFVRTAKFITSSTLQLPTIFRTSNIMRSFVFPKYHCTSSSQIVSMNFLIFAFMFRCMET